MTGTAQAKAAESISTPRVLQVVHQWRDRTWAAQQQAGTCCRRYSWEADEHDRSFGYKWHLAYVWYHRAQAARAKAAAVIAAAAAAAAAQAQQVAYTVTTGFPASCVANAEEGGANSVAGYFGTIYPPSSYPGGAAVAAQYGDSWLNVPYAAQLQVAEAEYAKYGGSAWGPRTRAACGI